MSRTLFPDDAEEPLRTVTPLGQSSLSLFPDEHSGPDPLHTALRLTHDKPPERAARVLNLQQRTGLPTAVIDRNLDELEKQAKLKDFDPEQFRRTSPIVAQWLTENPEHAAVAKDDLFSLATIESLLQYGSNLARSLVAAAPTTGAQVMQALRGYSENRPAISSWFTNNPALRHVLPGFGREPVRDTHLLTDMAQRYAQSAESMAQKIRPKASNRFEQDVYGGVEGAGQMALLLPLALAGGEGAMLAGIGLTAGGGAYGEGRAEGLAPSTASLFAAGTGLVNVAAMKLPVKGIVSEFNLHTGLVRLLKRELMTAIPGQEAATAIDDLNRWAFLPENTNKTFGDYLRERPSRAADALVNTIMMTVPMVGMTRGIDRALTGKSTEQLWFENLGKAVKDSKTVQRLPQQAQELMARITKDGPISTLYVDPATWTNYWQSKKVDPHVVAAELLGKDVAKYDHALETGHAIPIPTEAYAAKIAPTEHNSFFAQELRLDPEAQNAREASRYQQDVPGEEDYGDLEPRQQSIEESAAKIRKDIYGQLIGQGFSPEAVEAHAKVMELAFKNFVGERAGLDPWKTYREYGVLLSRTLPEMLTKFPRTDAYDVLLDRLRSGRTPQAGEVFGVSLVDFLRQKGGVTDDGGELKALEPDSDRKRGEKRLVRNKGGMALDAAREAAAEAGYLEKGSSTADLLDAIEREVRGDPVYAKGQEDQPALETATLMNQMQEYLQAAGVDIKKTSNQEIKKRLFQTAMGPEYEQRYGAGKRGGIEFGKDKQGNRVTHITLTESANLSTALHEFGHFWLEAFSDVASDLGQMTPESLSGTQRKMVDDYATVLRYLGVSQRSEIGESQHETFARSIEAYLTEGKAPSEELRSIFARFRHWLISAYRLFRSGGPTRSAIGATLDVRLSDEVRGVFDRLLASDEEIQRAHEQAGIAGMLEDEQLRARLGMTEAEYKPYQKLVWEVRDKALDKLDAQLAREQARVHEKWWQDRREEMRKITADEYYREPVYRALANLQRGEHPDGTELPPEEKVAKLDAGALQKRFGKFKDSPILQQLRKLDVYRREGGVDPDVAAELLGFKSGEDLVTKLAAAGQRGDMNALIDADTDQRMRQEFGDLQLSGQISEKARQAVMGPDRSNVIAAEMRAIRKKQREVSPYIKGATAEAREGRRILEALPDVETVRAWAERRISESTVRQLKPGMYWAAARKASKLAFEAAARDHFNNAYDQKLAELRNVELYRAATNALDAMNENIDGFGRMFRADSVLSRTHDMDYVQAARAIASTIMGYPSHLENAAKYLKKVAAYDPELYEVLSDQIEGALGSGKTYKWMSLDEFNGAADVINGLFEQAFRTRQLRIDGKLIDKESAIRDLHVRISRLVKPGAEKRGYEAAVSKWDKTKIQMMGAGSALRRVEFWIDAMDRDKEVGPFRTFRDIIWNPISDALGKYRVAKIPLMERFLEIVKPIEKSIASGKIEAHELGYTFENKGALLHAVLHSGNESNLQKLLRGRGWGQYGDDGVLDTSKWDAFIGRAEATGILTRADYEAIQQIWDLFESQKPAAQRAHKELYGSYFREVEAAPVHTSFGDFRGGYTPAVYDPWISADVAARAERQAFGESDNAGIFPSSTGRGFTKSRIEQYTRPLALDLRLLPAHLDKVLRFSFLQSPVKDVSRVLLDSSFQKTLGSLDPTVMQDMLLPWLQRTATQTSSTPSKGRGGQVVDRFFGALRKRVALNALTLNIADSFGRLTTIFPSALKVRPDYLVSGLWQYVRGPGALSDSIAEKSDFMKTRTSKQAAEMMGTIHDILLNPGAFDRVKDFAEKNGHFLQQGMHNLLDHSVWVGAYDEATANGASEPDAVRAADSVVRLTQGSYNPEDISRLEASSQFNKVFLQYWGYFNNQRQLLGNEFSAARELGLVKGAGRGLYVYTMGLMLPAVARDLIYRALGSSDSSSDESFLDTFIDVFFGSQRKLITAMIPGGGVVNAALNVYNNKPFDDRISTSPAISAIESAVRSPKSVYEAIVKGKGGSKAIRDVLSLVGLLSGLPAAPVGKPLGYLSDVQEGKADPQSGLEFGQGLISGRSPKK